MPFVSLRPNWPSNMNHFLGSCPRAFLKACRHPAVAADHPLEEKKIKERNDGPIIASVVRGECPGGGCGSSSLAESCSFLGFSILKRVSF